MKLLKNEETSISENITQAAKKKLNKKAIAFVGIAVIIVLIVIAIICSVANKPIYKSEEEMYAAFNGIWMESTEDNNYFIFCENEKVATSFYIQPVLNTIAKDGGLDTLKNAELKDYIDEVKSYLFDKSSDFTFDIKQGLMEKRITNDIYQITKNGTLKITDSSSEREYTKIADDCSANSFMNEYLLKEFSVSKERAIESLLDPRKYFAETKEIYEKVKPFFAKYGYNFDEWNVTVDDGNLFAAETSSEIITLQDTSLAINLDKGGNTARGLQVFTDGNSTNNIQLWFNGGEKDKAYELLDVIFDGALVDDKKLSEYIESEYKNHLNEGNVANWTNKGIKYTVQFNNDLTLISLYLS